MFVVPVNKDNPVKNIPWVVLALIAANTLALAATYFASSPDVAFRHYGFIPAEHRTVTIFSSMFLHAGFWHLAGNMWFLWMFGNRVENMFGRWLFLPVYLVCGLGAAALHYALNLSSSIPCVGASGAISGIVGIYFVLFPKSKFDLCIYIGWAHLKTIPARTHAAVGAWIGEQTVLGLLTQAVRVSSVAFWAHVGGFATGVAAALVFMLAVPAKQRRLAERAKPWYMQDSFNREEEHITRLKL
jgi:membrane associated rhomboid family serine protease